MQKIFILIILIFSAVYLGYFFLMALGVFKNKNSILWQENNIQYEKCYANTNIRLEKCINTKNIGCFFVKNVL